jgi:hypothetical protein
VGPSLRSLSRGPRAPAACQPADAGTHAGIQEEGWPTAADLSGECGSPGIPTNNPVIPKVLGPLKLLRGFVGVAIEDPVHR